MAEESTIQSSENWQDWSAERLAESYINFQIGETEAKVTEVKSALGSSYEPKPAMASANIQTGTMDAADIEVTQLTQAEDQYHPSWTVDDLNDFERELDGWKEDKEILSRKDEGSENLVQKYSAFERERREGLEKIKEQKKD